MSHLWLLGVILWSQQVQVQGDSAVVKCPVLVDNAQALVDAAATAKAKQQFSVASKCLDEALSRVQAAGGNTMTLASLHNEIGLTMFADPAHGPAAAVDSFERATAMVPSFPNAHFNAAACRAAQGQHTEAKSRFLQALELQPDNGNYHLQYAVTLLNMDPVDTAAVDSALEASIKYEPQNAAAYNMLGVSKVKGAEHKHAAELFQHAVTFAPNSAVFYANLGTTSHELKETEVAVAAFRAAAKLEPTKPEHFHNLGSALEAADTFPHDQLKEALHLYTKAATEATDNPLFQYSLCNAAFKLQDFEKAGPACDKGLELAPGYAPLHYSKGQILQEKGGNDEAALKSFQYASALDPGNQQYIFAIRGLGGTPPDYSQQSSPDRATNGASGAGSGSVDLSGIHSRLEALEKKVLDKLQKTYSIMDSMQERIERFMTETNNKLEKLKVEVLRSRNQASTSPAGSDAENNDFAEEAEEDGPIEPIYPPGGKAAFDALMGN